MLLKCYRFMFCGDQVCGDQAGSFLTLKKALTSAMFVTRNYTYEKDSMTGIFKQVAKWQRSLT